MFEKKYSKQEVVKLSNEFFEKVRTGKLDADIGSASKSEYDKWCTHLEVAFEKFIFNKSTSVHEFYF